MFGNTSRGGSQKYTPLPLHGKNDKRRNGYNNYSDSDSDSEEDDFIQNQIKSQQTQMRKQDEGLEMLSQSAERLGKLSLNINEELNSQNKMLDDMENDLDKATTNLNFVTFKTRELIKKSGGKKNFLIIVSLTLVVIFLIMLILYT